MTTIYGKDATLSTPCQVYLTLVDFPLAKYFHMRFTRHQLASDKMAVPQQFLRYPGDAHSDGSGGSIAQWKLRGGDCALPIHWRLPRYPDFGQFIT
jgi:hypothetical protein